VQSKLFDTAMRISGLKETDNLETLQKELESLQRRIARLKKTESPIKNSPAG
jgi:hypothetical protein